MLYFNSNMLPQVGIEGRAKHIWIPAKSGGYTTVETWNEIKVKF
jgi:hypothetical protein